MSSYDLIHILTREIYTEIYGEKPAEIKITHKSGREITILITHMDGITDKLFIKTTATLKIGDITRILTNKIDKLFMMKFYKK